MENAWVLLSNFAVTSKALDFGVKDLGYSQQCWVEF